MCEVGCVDLRLCRDEVSHLGKTIDDHEDSIERLGLWEMNDEVHRYILPWFFRWLERHDSTKWQVMAGFRDLALGAGACEFEDITFEMGAGEVALNIRVEFVEARVSSKRCVMNFAEKFGTKRRVVWDKDAKGGFTGDDEVMVECKARVILAVAELLIERGKVCVGFVGLVERVKQVGVRLGRRLELAELGSRKVIGDGVDVCGETTECVSDDVGFAGLVFDFEVVRLDGKDPTDDAISGRGGQL